MARAAKGNADANIILRKVFFNANTFQIWEEQLKKYNQNLLNQHEFLKKSINTKKFFENLNKYLIVIFAKTWIFLKGEQILNCEQKFFANMNCFVNMNIFKI